MLSVKEQSFGVHRDIGHPNTKFYSPCWSKNGGYVAFYAKGYIYIYDMYNKKLGKLCEGEPSIMFYHQNYIPPDQNFIYISSIFDMAYRTY